MRRLTIMLDEELHKKLREIQAKRLRQTSGAVSLSKVINDTLRKGLR